MTKKKKQMWTELELKGLLEDEDSCVYWEKVQKHLSLHPCQLKNNTVALNEMLMTNLNFYDLKLDGFPLLYQNPKLLTDLGEQLADICFIHIDIEVEYYIFRPEVGKHLKGIVTKKAINHIRVLVHRAFSVAIQKPPNIENWIGDKVRIGQEIKFTVTHLDYEFKYPVFKGTLDPDNYLDGCQLFDESKNEQVDEKPVLHSLSVAKKKKKTNDLLENQDTQVVKKTKKKKNDKNPVEEPLESTESTANISVETPAKHRSIKREKLSNLEGTAKVQINNSSNHVQPDENHHKSPKKKHHDNEYNNIGESKADLKKYKKKLHETLPDLIVNTDQPDSIEKKKKKKKRDKSKERNASFEDQVTSTTVDNSVSVSEMSNVLNVGDYNEELQSESTILDQHENVEEEFVKKKTKKKKKENQSSQDSEMQYTSETEKEYKKRLKNQLLVETASNHEMLEGGAEEEQVLRKKLKKKKTKKPEGGDSMSADICHSETERNYKKKLHKGLFSSTMIEDVEPNLNPEESEAEKRSKKELQNQLFKSPSKKSPKKTKKSNNWDTAVPGLNLSYPDSDDSCFSDNKEKMKKYKKALRKSLAIDDNEKTEAQPSPKKKSNKRKMSDNHDETAGVKVQIDRSCQPVFLTPKVEGAKASKKSRSTLNGLNSICFEDRHPGSNDVVKPNQTLTPPSSDSDNVNMNQSNSKKTKKVSLSSEAASKSNSGVTTSKPIKKEKN